MFDAKYTNRTLFSFFFFKQNTFSIPYFFFFLNKITDAFITHSNEVIFVPLKFTKRKKKHFVITALFFFWFISRTVYTSNDNNITNNNNIIIFIIIINRSTIIFSFSFISFWHHRSSIYHIKKKTFPPALFWSLEVSNKTDNKMGGKNLIFVEKILQPRFSIDLAMKTQKQWRKKSLSTLWETWGLIRIQII